jgi:ABC-2 type transport system ATP-binding protein
MSRTRESEEMMSERRENDVAIEVEHLVKRFARSPRNAVDDVSFSVRRGETFGLLGPNGAGKTTTIGVLTTRVRPTSGAACISGLDVAKDTIGVRQRIAVTPQRSNLDRSLRVGEILTYHAAYHGVGRKEREARARELLEEFGLGARAKQQLSIFSGGMEQRVLLARALMHDPDALFLDEPTNNLDPQARLFLWERIRALHDQGVTIVLTTHDMDEADRLCDRIAIMDHGRILALDTPEGLRRLIPGGTVLEIAVRVPQAALVGQSGDGETDGETGATADHFLSTLERLPGVTTVERVARPATEEGATENVLYRVYATQDAGALLASAAQTVIQEQGELLDLRVARPSLEDVFIHLTGRVLRS